MTRLQVVIELCEKRKNEQEYIDEVYGRFFFVTPQHTYYLIERNKRVQRSFILQNEYCRQDRFRRSTSSITWL
jgi:hypothetical protein